MIEPGNASTGATEGHAGMMKTSMAMNLVV
jgi:hypothetical protein